MSIGARVSIGSHAGVRLAAEAFASRGHDPQQPHACDEVYAIIAGRGTFVSGDGRQPFGPGNRLCVPDGMVHRVEDVSDDLMVRGIFHGPESREAPDGETR